jgi:hypothetical protein
MSKLNSSEVLDQLAVLRHIFWVQNFTFTPAQAAQWAALRQARWACVRQLAAA